MHASSPSLAIIIVTYNSRDHIRGCLESVLRDTALPGTGTTITIVDNASPDGTADLVRESWPQVQVIEAGGNVGFSRANNLGVRATASDYVLFLNPDTLVGEMAIRTMLNALEADAGTAIVGPRLIDSEGMPEISWGPVISPWGEFRQKRLMSGYARRVPRLVEYVTTLSQRNRFVEWVSGACLLARRTDLEAVGLFDERYFMYTEDVDLCIGVRDRGRHVRYVADAEVMHLRGRSARYNAETERRRRSSHLAYYKKHNPSWVPVLRAYLRLTGKPFES
jgi:N-acetylglucosaminyl-diphospho-decaprenol L-rhamnosyltransferase